MRPNSNRDLWIWLLVVIAVVADAGLASFNIQRMMTAEAQLQRSHAINETLVKLLSDIKDAEAGHRGYILTGDADYLKPFRDAEQAYKPHWSKLRDLVADRPEQQAQVAEIARLIAAKFDEMQPSILMRNRRGPEAAVDAMRAGHGKQIMDDLRKIVGDLREEENRRIAEQESTAAGRYYTAHITNAFGTVLTIAIGVFAALRLRAELNRRRAANQSLVEAKQQTEIALGQLRESEGRFRTLAEAMPQIVWTARPDGFHDYNNARWYEFTGTTPEESLGFHWSAYFHPEDRERAESRWSHSIRSGEMYESEHRIRRGDGNYRWFLARAVPVRDDRGRVVRWLGTCTDIDDNRRLADTLERTVQERTAALLEQRTFLDAILNNISEGVAACDAAGRVLFNRAAQQLYGLPADASLQSDWTAYVNHFNGDGETPLPPRETPLERARGGEVVRDAEVVVRAKSGPEHFLLCTGQPLVNAAGTTFGAVVSMRDVTERRAYEQQLLQTAALLRTSNEDLERFAYVASHDLQEPLRKIQAFGDRLMKKQMDRLDAEGQDALHRMLDAAGRMRGLIDDLLAFSKINIRGQPFEPVPLNQVLADVIDLFEMRLAETGGQVRVNPLPTLPGDASQLRQLFQNLIGNSLKFARSGEPPRVEVTATEFGELPAGDDPPPLTGDGWRIRIRDNGIGFESQYAERIFELFQRLHGRGQYEGTGLGLAICRRIAQRHGATIVARGRPGQGAAFIVDWPLEAKSRTAAAENTLLEPSSHNDSQKTVATDA